MALPLPFIRVVVLSTAIIFALIDIGLAAALTATSVYLPYAVLAITSAALTLLTLPAMIGLEILRPSGPLSMIIVEIPWLFSLSILWLATWANSVGGKFSCGVQARVGLIEDKPEIVVDIPSPACHEIPALEAFAFLNWILLLAYTGTLLILALGAACARREHTSVWTSSVANTPFVFAFGAPAPAPAPGINMLSSRGHGATAAKPALV
ncbi:hypothetical protein DFH07DRAFT_847269 [Mycena maculata]|uniref:MARVEL domain-containing protein n=1 Tax=Mycena maculata TaxID=230809 RepID=A0AAD7HZT7_9AGAR|nr:hypothetical protein DFH07DRAFT_847269 [Mycena maculata]